MRRFSSLSVDLDNHWSYLKTHGSPAWREFPSYLDRVVPLVCDFADRSAIDLTLFVVGQDAELPANAEAMAQIGDSRHEVGNHSFHHEPWLHLKTTDEIEAEVSRSHNAIAAATGRRAFGFRGPGFSISAAAISALDRHGYLYDASTLPTFIGPLARAYYMRSSGLSSNEMAQRSQLFGTVSEVSRPIRPYQWQSPSGTRSIVEIPVTTMPLLRVPFHATYLLYLATFSHSLSRAYLRMALRLCAGTGVQPSLLLHSLDFIGPEDISDLGFFPGMDMSGEDKRRLLDDYVTILGEFGDIVTVGEHAAAAVLSDLQTQRVTSLA